jgi:uncharacterized delta-60 repeat protein
VLERLENRISLSAGDLDPTFGSGGIAVASFARTYSHPEAVALQPDGKIVVAGWTPSTANGDGLSFALARFNVDGSLDPGFGSTGKVITDIPGYPYAEADAIALQANGQIVVAGWANTSFGGSASTFALARYNGDGSLDTSFGTNGRLTTNFTAGGQASAQGVVVQADGKIVAAGSASAPGGPMTFALARYNADGTLDSTFGVGGKVITAPVAGNPAWINDLALQPDGKIVVAGSSQDPKNARISSFALARYNADGSVDTSFGSGGSVLVGQFGPYYFSELSARNVFVQTDGRIVAVGEAVMADPFLIPNPSAPFVQRYHSDGSPDTTFGQGSFANEGIQPAGALLQPDSKIVVSGSYQNSWDYALAPQPPPGFDNTVYPYLLRSDASDNPDSTFGAGGQVSVTLSISGNHSLALQADGKIVQVGVIPATGHPGEMFAVARYLNDLKLVQFASPAFTVHEQDGQATVTVTRSGDPSGEVTVHYATANGTAIAGVDYTAAAGTLTFGPGQQSQSFSIPVTDNHFAGAARTLNVTLSDPGRGSVLGQLNTADVSIIKDSPNPLQFSAAAYAVHKSGGSVTITVTRIGDSDTSVTVAFATANGTAMAGVDYTAVSGVLTFSPGDSSKTFTVAVNDNGRLTGDSTVNLALSSPTGAGTLGSTRNAVLTIVEDNQGLAPSQRFVTQTYLDLLGRRPDPGGMSAWTGWLATGATPTQVASWIQDSPEYRTRVAQGLYQKSLYREADPQGLAQTAAALGLGTRIEHVQATICGSAEYFQARGRASNDGFLTTLYQDVFQRSVDPSGQATFGPLLNQGATRTQVADLVFASDEFRLRFVQGSYERFLGREPDPVGLGSSIHALKQGVQEQDIIAALIGSGEYSARL